MGDNSLPQNLRWGTAHASVSPIFGEVVLWDARESTKKYDINVFWNIEVFRQEKGHRGPIWYIYSTCDSRDQGRPSPSEAIMHFLSVSDFPPIFDKFSDSVENFKNFTFSQKNVSIFIRFFSHQPQISNFPLFSVFQYISPLFRENYYSPTLKNVPPVLEKFTCFLHTLCVFRFPLLWPWCIYASPNARTGRFWYRDW